MQILIIVRHKSIDAWVEKDVVDEALVASVEAEADVAEFQTFRFPL